MKKILAILATSLVTLLGASQAANIAVTNSDFESPYALTANAYGASAEGAVGWVQTGLAGTFDPDDASSNGPSYGSSSDPYGRVGWVNANSSLSQDLGTVIATNVNYTLSAIFGHRNGLSFGGTFGFTANGVVIGTTAITDPGDGSWGSQSFTLDAAFLAAYVGQTLGIIFLGTGLQFNFDDVAVAWDFDKQVVPLPGAIWLFGSALLGGGFIKRRRKKTA